MESIIYSLLLFFFELVKIITIGSFLLEIKIRRQHKKVAILFIAFATLSVILGTFTKFYAAIGLLSTVAYCLLADNKKNRINIIIAFMFLYMLNMASDLFILQGNVSTHSYLSDLLVKLVPLIVIILCVLLKKLYNKYHPNMYGYLRFLLPALLLAIFVYISHSYIELNTYGTSYYSVEDFSFLGFGIGSIVMLSLLMLLLKQHNEQLETNAQIAQQLIESQKKYYTMLLQKEEDSKRFRHDIKNHLFCIDTLFKEEKYDELGRYLTELVNRSSKLSKPFSTSNELVDIILSEICLQHPDVAISVIGVFPGDMKMTQFDQCAIFSNLFSNAFEAADKCADKKVNINIKALGQNLYISVSNTYNDTPLDKNGKLISSKQGLAHGYGISNIKSSLKRYNGIYEYFFNEKEFISDVVIPGIFVDDQKMSVNR